MRRTILWIVGEPGVGKTTLARAYLATHGSALWEHQSPKWTGFGRLNSTAAGAGWWRGTAFDGTDTLAISQIKPAMQYWAEQLLGVQVAVLDGDKLSNAGAVEVAIRQDTRLVCCFIGGPEEAEKRRFARGTIQNPKWVKGRQTKAFRFFESFLGERVRISASTSLEDSLGQVIRAIA